MNQTHTKQYVNQETIGRQLTESDIILMIPGRLDPSVSTLHEFFEEIPLANPDANGFTFIDAINSSMEEELSQDFLYRYMDKKAYDKHQRYIHVDDRYSSPIRTASPSHLLALDPEVRKKLEEDRIKLSSESSDDSAIGIKVPQFERFNLGDLWLFIDPDETIIGKKPEVQEIKAAFGMLLLHTHSRCCVFEIYIPKDENSAEGNDTVHILEAYRHGRLYIRFSNEKKYHSEKAFLEKKLRIQPYGTKRSAVFTIGDIRDETFLQQCTNCLANEEAPKDGHVAGRLREKIFSEDRSQYEGIHTYASTATLLEVIESDAYRNMGLSDRLGYQTTEIFFIEMLLLRDASTEDIIAKLFSISDRISAEGISGNAAREELEKIHRNLSNAIRFTGTRQYLWPTVQESVRLLSSDFDLDAINRRYADAENVIEDKIDALVRSENAAIEERRKHNENIQKFFLFFLTLYGWMQTVSSIFSDMTGGSLSFQQSAAAVFCFILLYYIIVALQEGFRSYFKGKKDKQ